MSQMSGQDEQDRTRERVAACVSGLKDAFGDRVWFCGLQRSRVRRVGGGAPLDIVVVLDDLVTSDIASYRQVIERIPGDTLQCGFVAGKNALLSWEPAELFHLCNSTMPVIGSLDEVAGLAGPDAARRAAWSGATGVYQGTVRNMVYDRSPDVLVALFQSAITVMSALYFLRSGTYHVGAQELLDVAEEGDAAILEMFQTLDADDPSEFDVASGSLFEWARDVLLVFSDGTPEAPLSV